MDQSNGDQSHGDQLHGDHRGMSIEIYFGDLPVQIYFGDLPIDGDGDQSNGGLSTGGLSNEGPSNGDLSNQDESNRDQWNPDHSNMDGVPSDQDQSNADLWNRDESHKDQWNPDHSNGGQSNQDQGNGNQQNGNGDYLASLSGGQHQTRMSGNPSSSASNSLTIPVEAAVGEEQDKAADEVVNEEEDGSDVVGEGGTVPVCIEERERWSGRVEAEVLGAGGADHVCLTNLEESEDVVGEGDALPVCSEGRERGSGGVEAGVLGAGGADIVCVTSSEGSGESTSRAEPNDVNGVIDLGEDDLGCTAEREEESSGVKLVRDIIDIISRATGDTQESERPREGTAEAGAGQGAERGIPVLPVERPDQREIPVLPVERLDQQVISDLPVEWPEHRNEAVLNPFVCILPDGRGRPQILLSHPRDIPNGGRGMSVVLRPIRKPRRSAGASHDGN